jgi:peptidoglycan/xylan/chitin deacetylase (PgdA/CDA1 family)
MSCLVASPRAGVKSAGGSRTPGAESLCLADLRAKMRAHPSVGDHTISADRACGHEPSVEEEPVRGKRDIAVRVLDGTRVISALLAARRHVAIPWLTVLTYHRVGPRGAAGELDDGVLDATPEQFDEQLALAKEHFEPVGIDDVVAWLRGAPLPKNPLLVTFDDGYLDCLTVALPILKKHGIAATFFLATDYISERRLFWWDRIALLLKRSRREVLELKIPDVERLPLGAARSETERHLLQIVKKRRSLDLDAFLDDVARAADVQIAPEEERALVDRYLMTWDHVGEMARAGMDIGSHTRSHRILQTLDEGALDDELEGSRRDIEERTGRAVASIAYPVGYPVADYPRIIRALSRSGYEVGFSAASGASSTWVPPSRWDVRRIAMDVDHTPKFFRGILALPALAYARPGGSAH